MLRCSSVILLSIIMTNQALDFLYDKVTTTLDGEPCLSNCVNNKCVIDYDLNESSCNPGTVDAALYYTSQYRSKKKFCLSACGRFGWEYDWCVVTATKKEWDYCNAAERDQNTIVRGAQFTVKDHLCKDECKLDENNKYTCTDSWEKKQECNPKQVKDYVQTKTSLGFDCVGLCSDAEKVSYLWCYYKTGSTPSESKKWFLCAPPVSRRQSLYNTSIYTYEFVGGDRYVV